MKIKDCIVDALMSLSDTIDSEILNIDLIGRTIKRIEFKDSDLLFTLDNGKQFLISAIISELTERPRLEYEVA